MQTTYFIAELTALPQECGIQITCTSKGKAPGTVNKLKIRRRLIGGVWATIYEKAITVSSNFSFSVKDLGTKALYEYEYAVAACAGDTDVEQRADTIKCVFDGIYISDSTATYTAFLNVSYDPGEHHNPVNKVETLGRKHPFIVRNGAADYMSGSVTGIFAPPSDELYVNQDAWKTAFVREYKNQFLAFLKNGLNKTLKTYDGQAWLVAIDTNPKETVDTNWWASEITFNWIEVGALPENVVIV